MNSGGVAESPARFVGRIKCDSMEIKESRLTLSLTLSTSSATTLIKALKALNLCWHHQGIRARKTWTMVLHHRPKLRDSLELA